MSEQRPPRLLQQVREKLRTKHYSYRTEQAYLYWIRWFILFSGKRHPRTLGKTEIEHFLTFLATERKVAASTQNQALSALLFLYKQVLDVKLEWLSDVVRAKRPSRVPVVLTPDEVSVIFNRLQGRYWLMAALMFGGRAAGYDIRTVQELLGHKDVKTTQIYTHVLQRGGAAVRSPMDALAVASSSQGAL